MNRVKVAGIVIVLALVCISFNVQPAAANPSSRWDSLNTFMTNEYDTVEGGYSGVGFELARLIPTYAAATIMEDRGLLAARPPPIDLVKMKNFTRKIQWRAGGDDYDRYGAFAEFIAGPATIETSYYGLKLWKLMLSHYDVPGMENVEINETAVLVYVNKTQTESGGFGIHEGESPDIVSTYYAIYVMTEMITLINEPSEVNLDTWLWNLTATTEWILSCRDGNGFKLSPESNIVGVTATAAALLTLEILQVDLPTGDLQSIQTWIIERQTTGNESAQFVGGFEEARFANDTNLLSTYHALQALDLLNAIPSIDVPAAAEFILNCQADDGAWGSVPDLSGGSLQNAAFAVEALRILDETGTYSVMLNEEDPNNPQPPLIDWRIIVIIGIVVIATVVAYVSLRMD
ncbi:MAG: prenyltransferase/squalene oxidase repeat-containing protein [Candidatus Thorarchaeota archaeon]|jgi:prenyltransferase beta subunit